MIKKDDFDVKNCILLWYLRMQERKIAGITAMVLIHNNAICNINSIIKITKLTIATKHLFIYKTPDSKIFFSLCFVRYPKTLAVGF